MNEPNMGTRRPGIYPPGPKRRLGVWIAIAAAAVALVLFLGLGGREKDRVDGTRGTPAGMGRRPVDDSTVRPNTTPRPNNPDPAYDRNMQAPAPSEDTLQPLPPSGEVPSRGDVPPSELPPPEQVPPESHRMP